MYLILTLDSIVQKDYVVVYFHTLTTQDNNPSLTFLKDVYNVLEYKYKKNLRAFYIVHPTFWSRVRYFLNIVVFIILFNALRMYVNILKMVVLCSIISS